MEEENILYAKIEAPTIYFYTKLHFVMKDFSDDRLEKDLETINSFKKSLMFLPFNEEIKMRTKITEYFRVKQPKLKLKWRLIFLN